MASYARNRVTTRTLPPPAPEITPAVARRWLERHYYPLASLGALGAYPSAFRGFGLRAAERERAVRGACSVGGDVVAIARACGRAITTGKSVAIRFDPEGSLIGPRNLRALVKLVRAMKRYDMRVEPRALPSLERALRAHANAERDNPEPYREQRALRRQWRGVRVHRARPEASA